jgi:hypothetical protein
MARSNYVYIVRDGITGDLVAAFTVKHELRSWLDGWGSLVAVSRLHDGPWNAGRDPVHLNPRTLERAV